MENKKSLISPTTISIAGLGIIVVAFLTEEYYIISVNLSILSLMMFVVSFLLDRRADEKSMLANTINFTAFAVFIINTVIFLGIGGVDENVQDQEVSHGVRKECTSRLVHGSFWSDTYEEGSKYIPVAPTYYFYMRGRISPSNSGLSVTGYVFGKAWYVFWTRWGHVDLNLTSNVFCDGECIDGINKCKADISTTGNSERQVSIVRGVADVASTASGNEVKAVVAISGSLSADGGPSISAGKDPLKISISWPNSRASNTMQGGTYKWRCECPIEP